MEVWDRNDTEEDRMKGWRCRGKWVLKGGWSLTVKEVPDIGDDVLSSAILAKFFSQTHSWKYKESVRWRMWIWRQYLGQAHVLAFLYTLPVMKCVGVVISRGSSSSSSTGIVITYRKMLIYEPNELHMISFRLPSGSCDVFSPPRLKAMTTCCPCPNHLTPMATTKYKFTRHLWGLASDNYAGFFWGE